jgi:hypothetical protein
LPLRLPFLLPLASPLPEVVPLPPAVVAFEAGITVLELEDASKILDRAALGMLDRTALGMAGWEGSAGLGAAVTEVARARMAVAKIDLVSMIVVFGFV